MNNLKQGDLLYCIDKYCTWAKFNWFYYKITGNKIQYYDNEEKKRVSQSYVIRHILENGMLDECFKDWEILLFSVTAPPRFQKEIELYLNKEKNNGN